MQTIQYLNAPSMLLVHAHIKMGRREDRGLLSNHSVGERIMSRVYELSTQIFLKIGLNFPTLNFRLMYSQGNNYRWELSPPPPEAVMN